METMYFVVESIDGDYANLRRTDIASEEYPGGGAGASADGDQGRHKAEVGNAAV